MIVKLNIVQIDSIGTLIHNPVITEDHGNERERERERERDREREREIDTYTQRHIAVLVVF